MNASSLVGGSCTSVFCVSSVIGEGVDNDDVACCECQLFNFEVCMGKSECLVGYDVVFDVVVVVSVNALDAVFYFLSCETF